VEEHALDTPITTQTVTTKYHVVRLTLDLDAVASPPAPPGAIRITLRDNLGGKSEYGYDGLTAQNFIRLLNTANLTTKSMHKRILEKLEADGKLPPGTIVGAPDGTLPE